MDIEARHSRAVFGIGAEKLLEFIEHIGIGAEVTEIQIAAFGRQLHGLFHAAAIVAMERIALHERRPDVLAPENLIEGLTDRRCA